MEERGRREEALSRRMEELHRLEELIRGMEERRKADEAHNDIIEKRQKADEAHNDIIAERQREEDKYQQLLAERRQEDVRFQDMMADRQRREQEEQRTQRKRWTNYSPDYSNGQGDENDEEMKTLQLKLRLLKMEIAEKDTEAIKNKKAARQMAATSGRAIEPEKAGQTPQTPPTIQAREVPEIQVQNQQSRSRRRTDEGCYKCGQLTHWSRECPQNIAPNNGPPCRYPGEVYDGDRGSQRCQRRTGVPNMTHMPLTPWYQPQQ
ncbi:hypothetical protein CesoFtcFv8_001092 [Champsocephalus esox]|uniref:CCHC-type domain-containing protein n=1 Tax=Champsocephalus esox TaxID=159716 RepID=A0AAN8DCX8_9TELE|nr:hypothetical protein CesoFtcFv8_001092 [Champsocephalus esox]